MSQTNTYNPTNCSHCAKSFNSLGTYTQGKVGTITEPRLGPVLRSAYGGVGFSSSTKAYQNEGSYATLQQAYPQYVGNACNPRNFNQCN